MAKFDIFKDIPRPHKQERDKKKKTRGRIPLFIFCVQNFQILTIRGGGGGGWNVTERIVFHERKR